MRKLKKSTAIAALIASLAPGAALAQRLQCVSHETIVSQLAKQHRETRQALGIAANGAALEVFANTDTRTWTIVVSAPSGVSCIVASGYAFDFTKEQAPGPGEQDG